MTSLGRRALLQAGAGAAVGAAAGGLVSRPLLADFGRGRLTPVPPIQDPDIKELALRAVEVSRTAGAAYADVRFTHNYDGSGIDGGSTSDGRESMTVGVRALVNGCWGFAASNLWSRPGSRAKPPPGPTAARLFRITRR